ncbi:MAG: type IV toxin-antitoxin system AbiEi family antitoxin domain-containing protein [Bacteroidota bacterium]
MTSQAKQAISKEEKVLSTQELRNLGLTKYAVNKLIEEGHIERVRRGFYLVTGKDVSDRQVAGDLIPSGIFCLQSAAVLYDYTTHVPQVIHMAIRKKERYTLPEYPPIKLYYWKGRQYELGVSTFVQGMDSIVTYDKEKTVCDFLKFRNKQERSVVNEVLRSYINDTDRNLNKLHLYARELGLRTVLEKYLQPLL